METVFRKTFSNETVVLDDKFFVDCIFSDVQLVFAGGHFDWSNPKFEQHCTWTLAGKALETTRFLKFVALMNPGAQPPPPCSGTVPNSDSARL